jgi:hypothetical protein
VILRIEISVLPPTQTTPANLVIKLPPVLKVNLKTKPSAMSKVALTKKPMNMPILSARAKQRFLFVKSPLKTQITA